MGGDIILFASQVNCIPGCFFKEWVKGDAERQLRDYWGDPKGVGTGIN